MKDHEGDIRRCYWTNKHWPHARNKTPEVMFGLYCPEGGTSGEMAFRWRDLGGVRMHPQLCVFDDGWSALATFTDLIQVLADHDNTDPTPEEIIAILVSCGFTDMTDAPKED